MKLLFDFVVDKENKRILVKREFSAEKNLVWEAWTNPIILDLWWAPKPYQTKTKSMDFRIGGTWLYAMFAPDGQAHWCRADYTQIETEEYYSGLDAFCDEEGNINNEFPRTVWNVSFEAQGENTLIHIENQFEQLSDLEKIIELGFKEGFTMAMSNLDEVFASKKIN
jgi:uncharacterized protein YndB with AHSA1/START domain